VLLPGALALVGKGVAALAVPLPDVTHLLLLERPPETGAKPGAPRGAYLMLPLAPSAAKGRPPALLLLLKGSDTLPPGPGAAAAPAVGVLTRLLGEALGRAVESSAESGFLSSKGAACVAAHIKVGALGRGVAPALRSPLDR